MTAPANLDHRKVFGAYPTGVAAVAAVVDGRPTGLAANSFTSVSLDPPLVSVCVAHSSSTWPTLRQGRHFGVSVLGAHQEDVSRLLAAKGVDRFAEHDWTTTDEGAVLLAGASAWFVCSLEDSVAAGDHDIVVLRVHDLGSDPDVAPLVFHGSVYRRLHDGESTA